MTTGDRPHRTGYAVQQRPAPKRLSRPATAPSADDLLLLPSLPYGPAISFDPEHPPHTAPALVSAHSAPEDVPDPYPSLG